MTIEEILARMEAIVSGAADRSLTDAEVTEYEGLEAQLATAQRTEQIRARQRAYAAPAPGQVTGLRTIAPAPGDTAHGAADAEAEAALTVAFEAYLRTGQPNADIASLAVRAAQQEGVSTSGGYTVPTTFLRRLVEVMAAYGGLATAVEELVTTDGSPIEYPTLDDTANVGGISNESAAVTSGNDLVFGSVTLSAYSYTSAGAGSNLPLRVSWELLQDSAVDISGIVTRALGTRISRAQSAHWCTGTGVQQPQGLVAPGLTQNVDLITPDTIVYADLIALEDALDPAYEANASWVMKKNTWSQVRKIVDTTGRPLIQDSQSGITGRPERTLLGYPVIIDQAMPTLSSAAITFPIAFGDFRESYIIRRAMGVAVVVNPYSRSSNRETEFTAWQRADGKVQNRSSYVILRNNT